MSSRTRFWAARVAVAVYLAATFLLVGADGTRAVTYTVTTFNDSGPGSLRQAIDLANQSAGADTITFDIQPPPPTIPPSDPTLVILLLTQLPDITDQVTIDATTQSGYAGQPVVEIRGPVAPDQSQQLQPTMPGLVLAGASTGSVVRGLSLTRFTVGVVMSSSGNSVERNWIGVGVNGGAGPNVTGIQVNGSGNTVGPGNVISANDQVGIEAFFLSNLTIQGNRIGTTAAGDLALPNGTGISLFDTAVTQIGGPGLGQGNVISGNAGSGVALPCFEFPGGSGDTTIQGNYIGTNAAGTAAMPNLNGITVDCGTGTLVGGPAPAAGNIISGNNGHGIFDQGTDEVIQGNRIGVDANGNALGNAGSGVYVGSSLPEVGGDAPEEGNVIAFNGGAGVAIAVGTGNPIRLNSIHDNGGLGIDLNDDGPSPNDPGDGDLGANLTQNFPVLTSAVGTGGVATIITGTLDTQPGTYAVDFYGNPTGPDAEGQTYLGSVTVPVVSGPATFSAPGIPLTQPFVTATATDTASLNTSEFSPAIAAQFPVTITTQASPSVPVGGQIFDTASLSGDISTTGTVVFRLYGPDDATCAGPPVVFSVPVVGDQFVYQSPSFTATAAGTYRWVAEYQEAGETLAATLCNDPGESVVVTRAAPTIVTRASPGVTLGGSISDTATMSGGFNPTGTVTFNLYGPDNSTCTGGVVFSSTVPLVNGTAASGSFIPNLPGTYRWVAFYSGDANNQLAEGLCDDPNETVIVSPAPATTTSTTTTLPPTTTSTTTTLPPTTTSTSTTLPPTTTSTSTSTSTTVPPTTSTSTTAPTTTTSSTTTTLQPTTTTVPPTTTTSSTTTTSTTTTVPPVPPGTTTTVTPPPAVTITSTTTLAATTTPTTAAPTTTSPTTTVAPTTPTTPAPPTTTTTAPAGPASTLNVVNPDGEQTGPPGVGLDVSGGGYFDCERVYFFFDGVRIGSDTPDAGGAVGAGRLSVPGNAKPGEHRVTSSCNPSGEVVRASSTFLVTAADVHRTAFVTSLAHPDQISLELQRVMASAAVAGLIILLFAFPSKLFNASVEENYDEIRGWLHMPGRAVETASSLGRAVTFVVMNLLAAIVLGFLDPDFGPDINGLVTVVGFFASFLVMSAGFSLPADIGIYRRTGKWGKLNFLPGTLIVSVVMVALSRVMDFQPGYFYGAIAGLAFAVTLNAKEQGRLTAANWTWALLLSLAAWFARIPVAEAAAQPDASVWWIGLEAGLVITFLWGVESLVVAMLPMRFLDGPKVRAWSRTAWLVLLFVGILCVVHVLLAPTAGYVGHTTGEVTVGVIVIFLIFGAVSVGMWAYFRYRPERWIPKRAR